MQSAKVSHAVTSELEGHHGESLRIVRDPAINAGETSVVSPVAGETSQLQGPVALLEVRTTSGSERYTIEKVPAIVGRQGAEAGDDEYVVAIRGVREISRRHLRIDVESRSLCVTVLPEASNSLWPEYVRGTLEPGESIDISYGQRMVITDTDVEMVLYAPEPPVLSHEGLQTRLDEEAETLAPGSGTLVARIDPVSYGFWTAFVQRETVFKSKLVTAFQRASADPVKTAVGARGEPFSRLLLMVDQSLDEGDVRLEWEGSEGDQDRDGDVGTLVAPG